MWQSLTTYILGTVVALIPIANPIGAVPIFFSLTAMDTPKYRRQQAYKTMINFI